MSKPLHYVTRRINRKVVVGWWKQCEVDLSKFLVVTSIELMVPLNVKCSSLNISVPYEADLLPNGFLKIHFFFNYLMGNSNNEVIEQQFHFMMTLITSILEKIGDFLNSSIPA